MADKRPSEVAEDVVNVLAGGMSGIAGGLATGLTTAEEEVATDWTPWIVAGALVLLAVWYTKEGK